MHIDLTQVDKLRQNQCLLVPCVVTDLRGLFLNRAKVFIEVPREDTEVVLVYSLLVARLCNEAHKIPAFTEHKLVFVVL
jgi:hypothetical protein